VKADGTADNAAIFATGINGPDGIAVDKDENIWICANRSDEIVVLDPTSKVVAKLGDFRGISPAGVVEGFLVPTSLAFNVNETELYVANLAIADPPVIDAAWTEQVMVYTVSKLTVPPIP
jgi:DNA-binding beta-propeller fold protein YncE